LRASRVSLWVLGLFTVSFTSLTSFPSLSTSMIRAGPLSAIIVFPSASRWNAWTSTFLPSVRFCLAASYSHTTWSGWPSVPGLTSMTRVQPSPVRTLPLGSRYRSWVPADFRCQSTFASAASSRATTFFGVVGRPAPAVPAGGVAGAAAARRSPTGTGDQVVDKATMTAREGRERAGSVHEGLWTELPRCHPESGGNATTTRQGGPFAAAAEPGGFAA
jgi:hypothetical protein